MALIVPKKVASDACLADEIVDTFCALLAMEVATVVTLILAGWVILRFAFLLVEREVRRQDEDGADNYRHHPKTTEVFDAHVSIHLDPLL